MSEDLCEYEGCDNPVELIDGMGSLVCTECMEREIEYEGADYEDFQSIE